MACVDHGFSKHNNFATIGLILEILVVLIALQRSNFDTFVRQCAIVRDCYVCDNSGQDWVIA